MEKGVLVGFFGVVLLIISGIGFASAFSGAGDGSLATPYIITNCTQLQEMNESLSANYSLGGNIDCSDTINWNFNNSGTGEYEGFLPVGSNFTSCFSGSLNGSGHVITGLYINSTSTTITGTGLFGVSSGPAGTGTVTELGLIDVRIRGTTNGIGALSGVGGYVSNCYSTGTVTGANPVGGLVGIGGTINNSHSSCNVFGAQYAGGLMGQSGKIYRSYAAGNVNGTNYVGGLIGESNNIVTDSYAIGNVSGTSNVGGLAGQMFLFGSLINNSYAIGNVSGTSNVGGLVGYRLVGGSIYNSFATGKVYGAATFGALAGNFAGTITNSYWYNNTDDNAIQCLGSVADACDANVQTSTAYFYSASNPPLSSWNFTGIWIANAGNYPTLGSSPSLGSLTVSLVGMANTTVTQGNSFTFSSNVSCAAGSCGNVSAYLDPYSLFETNDKPLNNIVEIKEVNNAARIIVVVLLILAFIVVLLIAPSNKKMVFGLIFAILLVASVSLTFQLTGHVSYEVVSTTVGNTPFYTNSLNPQNCGVLASGDSCTNTWTVYATGNAAAYEFFVKYNSTTSGVGEKNSSSVYITINVPVATTAANTSEGGGRAQKIYEISEEEFRKGYRHEVYVNDMFRFNFMGGIHTLRVISIKSGEIRFVVASEPITVDIKTGETKQIDIDGNGEDDMIVELKSAVLNGVADIVLKKKTVEQPLLPANETAGNESIQRPAATNKERANLVSVIVALAVVIIFLVLSRALVNRIKGKRLRK